MDYKYLRELNEIFKHRGDAQVLVSLGRHPSLRYSELARAIIKHTGERLGDGQINRCLPRLEANNLLIGEGPERHKTYRLTPRGRDKAAVLAFILESLERRDDHASPKGPVADA